jgi:hypothetical protein
MFLNRTNFNFLCFRRFSSRMSNEQFEGILFRELLCWTYVLTLALIIYLNQEYYVSYPLYSYVIKKLFIRKHNINTIRDSYLLYI